MKRVVILSFDSFGDLTLRQPLFTALLEAGDQVTVAVRQGYDRLLPFLDPRLGVVTTEIDPYRPSDANTPGHAEALRLDIDRLQPQLLVCAPYNRTSLDEWLLGQFPAVERIGLCNPSLSLARCDPESVNPDKFLQPVRVEARFTDSVACDAEDHEAEKNRLLYKAITHQDMGSYVPRLTVPDTLTQSALQLLQSLGLEAGHYVVGCPAGGCNVPLKAWPAENYVAVLDHLYHQYHLPVLLTGIASEAAQLHAIAQVAQSQGVGAAVWIGS